MLTTARWTDWYDIDLFAQPWQIGFEGALAPLAAGNIAADQIGDTYHDPLVVGDYPGLYVPAPTFARPFERLQWGKRVSIPDFVFGTQRFRAPEWSGIVGDPMADSGGLRAGLLIEVVLTCIPTAVDLPFFYVYATFNGFGAGNDPPTADAAVGSMTRFGQPDAFPDMAADPINLGTPAISFPSGLARIWALVELPDTLAVGDFADLWFIAEDNPQAVASPFQWRSTRYRFITPPYPQFPNTLRQLTGDEQQPRLDLTQYEP